MATPTSGESLQEHLLNAPEKSARSPIVLEHATEAGEEHSVSSRKKRATRTQLIWRTWYLDLLACLVALISFAAIVITLQVHNHRPLPTWPLGISINALVSIFATILKIAMLMAVTDAISQLKWSWFRKPQSLLDLTKFDSASRGVSGSLDLIWRLRGMHLASLGALITIFAVANDPFIQQVVKYKGILNVMPNERAKIARTNLYDRHGIREGATLEALDLPMQKALYKGVYDAFVPVQPICTTGNCTFPDYRTVAMCGGCRDISSEIVYQYFGSGPNGTLVNGTVVTAPNPPANMWTIGHGDLRVSLNADIGWTMKLQSVDEYMTTEVGAHIMSKTNIITTTTANGDDPKTPMGYDGKPMMALQCEFWPCVRTYTGKVSNGEVSEHLVSVYNMSRQAGAFGGYAATPMPCLINGTYHDATEFKQQAPDTVPKYGLLPHNETAWLPNECYYELPSPLGLSGFLPSFLTGEAVLQPENARASSDWMLGLFRNFTATLNSVDATWKNLAESMTIHMRNFGAQSNSTPAIGQAWQMETYIIVQWPWLSFPAALLVLTLVLLLATINKSVKYSSNQTWKGSLLPLLFHGLDEELRKVAAHTEQVEEMELIAQGIRAKISDERGRIEFTAVS